MYKNILLLFCFLSNFGIFVKSQSISNDSLILHLSFDGHSVDSSDNGYNGVSNNIIYTTDRNNKPNCAAYFNGNNSNIIIPNVSSLDRPLKQFSLLITLRPETLDSVSGNLPGIGNGAGYEFLTIHRLDNDSIKAFFFSQIRASVGSPYYSWGNWQHFASYLMTWCTGNVQTASGYGKDTGLINNRWFTFSMVFDSGRLKIYHNCELVNDWNTSANIPTILDLCGTNPLQISLAAIPDSARRYGYRPFKGKMDELRIYTRALSQYEIKVYAGDSCTPPPIKIFPQINITYDSCYPNNITFTDITDLKGLSIKKRIWHFSNGDTSTDISFAKVFIQLGLYQVKLEIIVDANTSEYVIDSFIIKTTTPKRFLLLQDKELKLCTNSIATFNAFGGKTYKWEPCFNLSDCFIANPTITALNDEIYTVISTDYNNCKDSAKVKLILIKDDIMISIPTAFSPNRDGLNDYFGVLSKNTLFECEFAIFNRWGQIVFKTSNQYTKWNGNNTNNGDSFIWLLNYKSFIGCEAKFLKGVVSIIK